MFRLVIIWIFLASLCQPALASDQKRYASIVVDADSLEIIHARQIDEMRFPASLTKVMTLYLVFDALNAGTLSLDEPLTISANAARTPPVGLGLRAGETITVDQAIQALTVRSANDAAVVLAERLAGNEAAFARKMTEKARALHMNRTSFFTASGLPHEQQLTTARDMAKLASSLIREHRRYYHYFSQRRFTWKSRTYGNTNRLLNSVRGVDGIKTGYTNASGYNLVISAQRGEDRMIAVVLGGATGPSRDRHMHDLVERGFKAIKNARERRAPVIVADNTGPSHVIPVTANTPVNAEFNPTEVRLRGARAGEEGQGASDYVISDSSQSVPHTSGVDGLAGAPKPANMTDKTVWSIQLGTYPTEVAAQKRLAMVLNNPQFRLLSDQAKVVKSEWGGRPNFKARFIGFEAEDAKRTCHAILSFETGCLVIAPGRG